MRGTKRIVDVQVVTGDQFIDEIGVVGGFPRGEPQVLPQGHARCQLGQAGTNRRHIEGRIRRTLGASQVGHSGHLRPARRQPLQRGQRRTNAVVIGDFAVAKRHVEIATHQHGSALNRGEILQNRDAVGHVDSARCADDGGQVDQTVGVAPLVVIPTQHLHQAALSHGQPGVERATGRGADDVGGHQRLG